MSRDREEDRWDDALLRAFSCEQEPRDESVLAKLGAQGNATLPVLLRETPADGALPLVRAGKTAEVPAGRQGRYQVLGEIARGGLGIVLQARDTDLGRDVAMKVLPEDSVDRAAVIPRFVEEAQIGGQLQHPGIVPVYEMGLLEDRPYFTMKLIRGRTLSALLDERESVEEDRRRFLRIFEQVCQTMAYAHSRGVVHRDLKPANVMVGAFGEVQVIDWGCAKVLGRGGVADEIRALEEEDVQTIRSGPGGTETVSGSAIGTPAYMAPEQALGDLESIDERTDVFCLGGVLCEILTGRPPYVGKLRGGLLTAISRGDLTEAWERIDDCDADDDLKAVARDCLQAYRKKRPRDAGEVAKRVTAYLSSLETRAREAELGAAEERARAASERRAKRLAIGLGIFVLLSVVLGGGTYFHLRAKRHEAVAATGREVAAILAGASNLASTGDWDRALEEVRRAETRLHTKDADEETRALVVDRLDEYRAEAREQALLEEIEAVRYREDLDFRLAGESYAEGFRAWGIDVEVATVEEIAAKIRTARPATVGRILRSLDDWVSRRHTEPDLARKLIEASNEVDEDPWRQKLRLAILNDDRDLLRSLAASLSRTPRPPESVSLLAHSLMGPRGQGDPAAALEVAREGCRAHPGDFWLHHRITMLSMMHRIGDGNLSLQHARIAQALRPASPQVRAALGLAILMRLELGNGRDGDLEEAKACFDWTLARVPDDFLGLIGRAGCLARVGRMEEAREIASKILEDKEIPEPVRDFFDRLLGE